MPNAVTIISSILFIIAYILYAEVLRENTYLSRTIEVQDNQKIILNHKYKTLFILYKNEKEFFYGL